MSKTLIFTATYNEKENIKKLLENLNHLKIDIDILVIDDNSPDKTWEILQELEKNINNLKVIVRKDKSGLDTAHKLAFEYAKNNVPKPEAALIDKDLQFKPNGLVWYELINKQWMTKLSGYTDEDGYLNFRGFKGRYLVSISHAKEETFDIDLSDRNESVITLT